MCVGLCVCVFVCVCVLVFLRHGEGCLRKIEPTSLLLFSYMLEVASVVIAFLSRLFLCEAVSALIRSTPLVILLSSATHDYIRRLRFY